MSDTPLLRRLERYVDLTPAELDELRGLTEAERTLKAGEQLVREGETSEEMYVLQSGCMHASIVLADGARQILRIHHPGDLVNTTCLAWSRTAATVTAATEAVVSAFPRRRLAEIFREHPRLAALLHGLSTVDNVALSDRLASMGRTDGRARLGTLLLELWSRQKLTGGTGDNQLVLFLSQQDIADAVGLTKVHVNRLFREMTDTGLIEQKARRVRLLDPQGLSSAIGFVDRHADLATDWFPEPSPKQRATVT